MIRGLLPIINGVPWLRNMELNKGLWYKFLDIISVVKKDWGILWPRESLFLDVVDMQK